MTVKDTGCVKSAYHKAGSPGIRAKHKVFQDNLMPMSLSCFYTTQTLIKPGLKHHGEKLLCHKKKLAFGKNCMVGGMNLDFKYRGKIATVEDVEFIRKLIADNPHDSRHALSIKLCEAWNWRQTNGALKDMVCRGFMLGLHRAGYIRLPEKKCSPANPFVNRKKPAIISIDRAPIESPLKKLTPLKFCQVRRHELEDLFNSLLEQYHYLYPAQESFY